MRLALLALSLCIVAPDAHAFHWYWDAGGGIVRVANGNGFFSAPGQPYLTSGGGMGFQFSGMVGLNAGAAKVHLHLGFQQRLELTTLAGTTYGYMATYPMFRVAWQRIFVGIGATPLVWKRVREDPEFTYFTKSPSTLAIIGEAGFLFPITPEVAFFTSVSYQRVTATASPPVASFIGGMVGFQFYYGDYKRNTGQREFDGYRYPHGYQR